MTAVKEAALELIAHLPEEISWDELMRELYVRQKIESGLRDEEEDRVLSHEAVREQFLR